MSPRLVKLDTAPDLVDRVYKAVVDAISTGALPAGARVTQEDLAGQLAVSRQPVLQALRLLKNENLFLDAPGRGGLLVAPLDAGLITQVYQVRRALDALAARLAAQQRHRLAPRLLEKGRRAARGRDVAAMIDADVAFHAAIYAGSGNPLIEQSARPHWCHVRRAMGAVLQTTGLRQTVWDEHEAIAQAIAAGQADEAERLMSSHAQRAGDDMARRLSVVSGPAPDGPLLRPAKMGARAKARP
ncbi:MAG TPA: GntR family transcriptional regulator [Burkholderiaceae bacterium]|nr:GntR family transcriptional regulator [Burkholderiaceae bacterium]